MTGTIGLPISEQLREAWLEERRTGVGSSDAAAVAGLHPSATPLHVYLEKKGLWQDPDSERKRWGLLLEEVIATAYEEETGLRPRPPDKRILRRDDLPWMIASLDRVVETPEGPQVLEIKNVGYLGDDWGPAGTDEVPVHYHLQVQHQLGVTGWRLAQLAALFGGNHLRVYEIRRDERIIGALERMESEFWELVQKDQEPGPTWGHPATVGLIRGRYGVDPGLTVQLPLEYERVLHLYEDAKAQAAAFARDADAWKSQILAAMGEAGAAVLPNGARVERGLVNRKAYTVQESQYVRVRVKHPSA